MSAMISKSIFHQKTSFRTELVATFDRVRADRGVMKAGDEVLSPTPGTQFH